MSVLEEIRVAYGSYSGFVFPLVFVFIALAYFWLAPKKNCDELLRYTCIAWAVLIIPGLANVVLRFKADKGQNWLVYGILAASFLTVFTATEYLSERKRVRDFVASFILITLLLVAGIGFRVSGSHLGVFNQYKVDDEVIQIANAVEMLEEENGFWEPVMMGPDEAISQMKSVNPSICVYYGSEFSYSPQNTEYLMFEADNYGCNVLILLHEYTEEEQVQVYNANGFEEFMTTDHYAVYLR